MRFVVLLVLGSFAAAADGDQRLSLPDAIQLVGPSVVAIQCVFDRLPEQTQDALRAPFYRWVCGSGFIVNDEGYVLTALHVVEGFEGTTTVPIRQGEKENQYPSGVGRLVAGIALHVDSPSVQIRESTSDIQMTVVDRDKKHDVALLKMVRSPFRNVRDPPMVLTRTEQVNSPVPGIVMFDVARPAEGEGVAISGFPLYGLAMKTNSGTVASSWETDKRQSGPQLGLVDSYVTDVQVNPGDSGGPVYSVTTGAVIGLCDSFDIALVSQSDPSHSPVVINGKNLEYNSGLANVIPAKYLVQLLDKNKVKWFPTR